MLDHIKHAADAKLFCRGMHAALKAHAFAGFRLAAVHPLVQRPALRSLVVLRPRLLVVDQRALARAEGVVLQGGERDGAHV